MMRLDLYINSFGPSGPRSAEEGSRGQRRGSVGPLGAYSAGRVLVSMMGGCFIGSEQL